jgi:hypothetical protein
MVQQTIPADTNKHIHTHTHTYIYIVQHYKQLNDCLYGKEHTIQRRLVTSPCFACVLVCLSVAFKFQNRVTVTCKNGWKNRIVVILYLLQWSQYKHLNCMCSGKRDSCKWLWYIEVSFNIEHYVWELYSHELAVLTLAEMWLLTAHFLRTTEINHLL